MLLRLAAEYNVRAFTIEGKYGMLQGSARDSAILRTYAETGTWAGRTVELVRGYFADRSGLYVDIGANIGTTLIPIAQKADVTCVALEPEPVTYQYLLNNIAANCVHGNVQTHQVAAFSSRSSLLFEVSPDNAGDNRLRMTEATGSLGEELWHSLRVPAVPLDEIIPIDSRELVVKIDTQGAEPHVIEGGKATIARAGLLIMEFWPYGMMRMGADQTELLRFLASNFKLMSIAHGEAGAIPEPRPMKEACEKLSDLSLDPNVYVDIITGHNVLHALRPGDVQ
jgi:FkbM family methyltransferase